MKKFDYLRPKSLEEVLSLLNQYGDRAKIIAGGTDVIVMIKQKKIAPEVLISLQEIPELRQIHFNDVLKLGPMVTHRMIEKSDFVRKQFSALSDAVNVLGSIQIRNVATIGGNICTAAPSADTVPPLLVLGAQVQLKSLKGERELPLDHFFKGPGETVIEKGEILKGIFIPPLPPHTGSAYWKHQRRQALDLPILGVAVLLSLDRSTVTCSDLICTSSPISTVLHALEREELICKEVRIALGVAAPTPMRAIQAEGLLRGKKLSDELLWEVAEMAAKEAQPRDTIRGEAWYRREMIRVFVKRMAMKCIERILKPEETIFPERLW